MLHLKGRLLEIKEEFTYKNAATATGAARFFPDLLALLARATEMPAFAAEKHSKADEIIAYIQTNYQKDLSSRHLGEIFGYHPGYIGRLIRMATGMPTHQYLLNYRIERAHRLFAVRRGKCVADVFSVRFSGFGPLFKVLPRKDRARSLGLSAVGMPPHR